MQRVADEPAFVLHHHDWSETSLIVEVWTRRYGRFAVIAKGAKRPTSQLRPILLPMQPILISWSGASDVKTLKSAQWCGGHVMPVADGLLAGTYINEILLRLLVREDALLPLFDHYAQLVARLAQRTPTPADATHAAWLRSFELHALHAFGLLPRLDQESSTLEAVDAHKHYVLTPEVGLHQADGTHAAGSAVLGEHWLALHQSILSSTCVAPFVASCAHMLCQPQVGAALQRMLRQQLLHHCNLQAFRTRKMMQDMQHLAAVHRP